MSGEENSCYSVRGIRQGRSSGALLFPQLRLTHFTHVSCDCYLSHPILSVSLALNAYFAMLTAQYFLTGVVHWLLKSTRLPLLLNCCLLLLLLLKPVLLFAIVNTLSELDIVLGTGWGQQNNGEFCTIFLLHVLSHYLTDVSFATCDISESVSSLIRLHPLMSHMTFPDIHSHRYNKN